ncbi:MAG: hypothetical protein DRR16_21795 [Candidatus Parabeggiatoa sp. nov. 3]|nr:MAG: hypothetical protein DRR00_27700 [Gammaproteobacteria bacterium]RKZ57670.1 MAG: hypothetical protein DRQ99_26565 [Gammaproteobacteria bacterium]RKZ81590.1 MAG: hypothetical protein DRR16_21795 [Gammaproteobacteria bacterium]HEW99036.1 SGNH/GDSL hydrolase family protein [Beggiatoa sp.]
MPLISSPIWIYSTLALVLIISITLNAVLFYTAKKYYTRAKMSEVFPNHEAYFKKANAALPQKTQKRVILFGNSRIQEWTQPPQLKGFELINRGIGGETTAQNRLRFQQDVLALNPDIVILQLGANDLTALGVQPQWYKAITQHCQNNIKFIVDSLLAQRIEVIFLTLIPPTKPDLARRLVWHHKIYQAVEDINQYWNQLPPTKHLHIVDTSKILKDENGRWHPNVNRDTLHLTQKGYQYLNQALTPILKAK